MTMLRFLNTRERGLEDPLKLRRAETTRRACSLELSSHRDVKRIFTGSINSLDIDLTERRYLLSGGADGYIVIYDMYNTTGDVKHTCQSVGTIALNNRRRHKFSVETVLWYPLDTGMFTSSGTDRHLKVWDTNRLKPADEYEFSGIVYSHHMSPVATKHCLIAVGTQSSPVKLVDLKSGSATHTLKGHSDAVMCVKWSPYNEFILASGSSDRQIYLWDIRNAKGSLYVFDQFNGKLSKKKKAEIGAPTAHSGHVNGLQFTSDGLHLVSCGTDNGVHLWNTSSGKNTLVNYGRVPNAGKRTVQFAISNGSSPLIYIPSGHNIDVLDIYTGTLRKTLNGHFSQVNCCLFHPDFHELYSAGCDRNLLLWVPNTNTDYEDHLKASARKKDKTTTVNVEQRTVATADSWSSDEDV